MPAVRPLHPAAHAGGALALHRVRVAGLMAQEHSRSEMAARKAPSPHLHRVGRGRRRYKIMPREREPLDGAKGLVLDWRPRACPKCRNEVLRHAMLEVSCPMCGWAQLVRR